MPRPSKLTPDTQKRITEAISMGATYELAANYGGVAYNTFNEWMKSGEIETTGAKRELYEAIKLAEGEAAVKWLAKIEKSASNGNWQAAAWKLERRYPRDYGKTVHETEVVTAETKLIDAIRNREAWATFATVLNIYDGDSSLAEELFRKAGVPIDR